MGFNSSAVPQVHHSNVRQNTPTAVIVHNQSKNRYPPTKQDHLLKLLPYPIATQSVLERKRDQAASCQAQFQHSQSNLNQTQYHATLSQSTNAQQLRVHHTEGFVQKLSKILCCN